MNTVPLAETALPKGLIGGPFGSSLVNNDYTDLGVPVIRGTNLGSPPWVSGDFAYVSESKYAADLSRNIAIPGDLIFTQRGTLGQVGVVPEQPFDRYVISQSQMRLRVDAAKFDSRFVYYACSTPSFTKQVEDNAIRTGVPHINLGILARLRVPAPSMDDQRGIAEVLGALDDKIAANARFLTTARELVDAELASALAASAETRTVDDLAAFHNRRRVPLSANQRKDRAGDVPYYGAAGPIDTVDVALFDEEIVLVGEDGSVMTERGAPVVQYVWGPSWVNNHAHVLTGSSVSTPFLRVLMERGNVAHLVTGAVQPKLSMGNLKRLELSLPADSTQLQATVDAHAAIERAKKSESRLLAATRNALLPLLMSGKARVKDAESVVGEVL